MPRRCTLSRPLRPRPVPRVSVAHEEAQAEGAEVRKDAEAKEELVEGKVRESERRRGNVRKGEGRRGKARDGEERRGTVREGEAREVQQSAIRRRPCNQTGALTLLRLWNARAASVAAARVRTPPKSKASGARRSKATPA